MTTDAFLSLTLFEQHKSNYIVFKKNLNASKLSGHPHSGENLSKDVGGNVGVTFGLVCFVSFFCLFAFTESGQPHAVS